jgi:hypothetical protein
VLIQELYDVLDALEEDARSTAEDFAETGDLGALTQRLNEIGSRSYSVATAASQIAAALKFDNQQPF